jgi:hypothetical protein
MHQRHQVPILVRHVLERLVPQDTRIVDQDVHGAKGIDGGLDNLFALCD